MRRLWVASTDQDNPSYLEENEVYKVPEKDTIIVWTLDPDTGGWHSEGRFPLAVAEDKQTQIQIAGYACRLSQTRPAHA